MRFNITTSRAARCGRCSFYDNLGIIQPVNICIEAATSLVGGRYILASDQSLPINALKIWRHAASMRWLIRLPCMCVWMLPVFAIVVDAKCIKLPGTHNIYGQGILFNTNNKVQSYGTFYALKLLTKRAKKSLLWS